MVARAPLPSYPPLLKILKFAIARPRTENETHHAIKMGMRRPRKSENGNDSSRQRGFWVNALRLCVSLGRRPCIYMILWGGKRRFLLL